MFYSFGIVEMSIDSASELYATKFKVNEERIDILKEYCVVLDKFIRQHKADSFNVDIDDADKTIHIAIMLKEYIEEDPGLSMFVELIAHAVSFGIEWVNSDIIRLKLVFPSVWEESDE